MTIVPYISLIVATLGREAEILRFLNSAAKETEQNFEVIIVDQNDDDRVRRVFENFNAPYPLFYYHVPVKNASNARNMGAKHAKGSWLAFPDDDCCYSGTVIASANTLIAESKSQLICGAILDFNGQYLAKSLEGDSVVGLKNIKGKITEPALFICKEAFFKLQGFDTNFGPGSKTYAGEGLELGLRALKEGFKISFHTAIKIIHARSIPPYDDRAMRIGYQYSFANGLALARHYQAFALYFLIKQSLLLPARNILKAYPADKKTYYSHCLQGLRDGILLKRARI